MSHIVFIIMQVVLMLVLAYTTYRIGRLTGQREILERVQEVLQRNLRESPEKVLFAVLDAVLMIASSEVGGETAEYVQDKLRAVREMPNSDKEIIEKVAAGMVEATEEKPETNRVE